MLPRVLDLKRDLSSRSVFLFGPRQTGKTTLLRASFPDAVWYNLLRGDEFLALSSRPGRLREDLAAVDPKRPVVIDEIQKLPSLLDDVHDLIESRGFRFVLTGSSPAKLRRGGVNLLGGRARDRRLHPFIYPEFDTWNLERICAFGSLPPIHFSDQPEEDLAAYAGTYLQVEIQAEGLVRGIESFSRFMHVAALTAGQEVVFDRIASNAQVPARTVREYYALLSDTLVGRLVPPYRPASPKRKPVARARFYYFDIGVGRVLSGRPAPAPGTPEFGSAVEQYLATELEAWTSYARATAGLSYWRTLDGSEVDFVVADRYAIEVKAGDAIGSGDLRGLKRLMEEAPHLKPFVVSRGSRPRVIDGIEVLPVETFLERLWSDTL